MLTRTGLLIAALSVGLAMAADPTPERLDTQLNKRMDKIVEQLKAKYKNVGVLRFRVQEGEGLEQFETPLSGRMIEKIETLLIIHNGADESKALGVVREAGVTASGKGVRSWFSDTAERRKLFDHAYPLAWGDTSVEVDAFLTGKVALSKDRKKTTVDLELFDKAEPAKLQSLGTITLDTDRFILRDLGYSFALSRGVKLKMNDKRAKLADEDKYIIEDVNEKQPVKTETASPPARLDGDGKVEPDNIAGVAIEILVKGKPATIRESATTGDAIKWQVECPPAGSEVFIRLRNTTDKRLAAVLKLNGVSTNREQRDEPENARLWILNPKKSALLKGFVVDIATNPPLYKPFRVFVGDEAKKASADMGEKKGLIDVDVFEEGKEREAESLISSKGLPPSKEKQARSSYLTLRNALLKSSKLKTTTEVVKSDGLILKREVIGPDKEAIDLDQSIRVEDFPNPRLISRLTIKVIPADNPPPSD